MSGPKVVRVRSREELELDARALLSDVDDALEQLRRVSKRAGVHDSANEGRLEQRKERLESLFRNQRWAELATEVGRETAFLRAEVERVRTAAIAAVAAGRSRRLRVLAAAKTLSDSFARVGREPPGALREIATAASSADDDGLAAMETTLSQVLRQLLPATGVGANAAATALAARLGAEESRRSVAEWLHAQPQPLAELEPRLQNLLAQVESQVAPDAAQSFTDRAGAIALEAEAGRRSLLTDSLTLDLNEYLQRTRERDAQIAALLLARRALAGFGTARVVALVAQIDRAIEGGGLSAQIGVLLTEARIVADEERRELVAGTRRRAVLAGLASLGYQVEERMELALPKDGRIVVHKPGSPDYGIELAAPADAVRMQVQLVGADRPTAPRDARRDADMETIWCSDLEKLRAALSANGADLLLERRIAVGAQPVKTVSFGAAGDAATSNVARPLASRTLK